MKNREIDFKLNIHFVISHHLTSSMCTVARFLAASPHVSAEKERAREVHLNIYSPASFPSSLFLQLIGTTCGYFWAELFQSLVNMTNSCDRAGTIANELPIVEQIPVSHFARESSSKSST